MNRLNLSSTTFTLSPASQSDPEPARRLIVLFPSSETDTPALDHRIWEIARSLKLNVLLLSLSNEFEEEAQLRRKLITMAAVIKDAFVSTDILIGYGNDWVRQVGKIWQTGDVVACYANQKVGIMRKPLDQILKSKLEATVYILSDYQPGNKTESTLISKAPAWLGSLAIIAGFLWAEVRVIQLSQNWTHTLLIYMCVIVEIVLVWSWNLLFT